MRDALFTHVVWQTVTVISKDMVQVGVEVSRGSMVITRHAPDQAWNLASSTT